MASTPQRYASASSDLRNRHLTFLRVRNDAEVDELSPPLAEHMHRRSGTPRQPGRRGPRRYGAATRLGIERHGVRETDVDVPASGGGMSADVLQHIGPTMQSYVDERGFAGISVAVARHGQVVFDGQYGQRDKEAGR